MRTVKMGNSRSVKIVDFANQKCFISERDAEMDARATRAVRTAIADAKFCKKPIAGYDTVKKKAYIEYANGERKYVD